MGCCTFKSGCQLQSDVFKTMQTCHSWMQQGVMDISLRDSSTGCLMASTAPQRFQRHLCLQLHTLCAPLQFLDLAAQYLQPACMQSL